MRQAYRLSKSLKCLLTFALCVVFWLGVTGSSAAQDRQDPWEQSPLSLPTEPAKRESTSPTKKKIKTLESIDIIDFDSRARLSLYNPGSHDIFVSHLAWKAYLSGNLVSSSSIVINKTVQSKKFLDHDMKDPKNFNELGLNPLTEDLWKIVLASKLHNTQCIEWHYFYPENHAYKTLKGFLKDGFHSVPAATIYFNSSIDGHPISKDFEVFAVPLFHTIDFCLVPDNWLIPSK
jgi:hypothetical protein